MYTLISVFTSVCKHLHPKLINKELEWHSRFLHIQESLMGESLMYLANCPWFAKLKPSNYVVLTINNLLADLLPHQTFFCQMLKKSQFPKLSPCQTFPLYSITHNSSASKIVWQLATVRMCIHLPTYLNIHKPHISQFK